MITKLIMQYRDICIAEKNPDIEAFAKKLGFEKAIFLSQKADQEGFVFEFKTKKDLRTMGKGFSLAFCRTAESARLASQSSELSAFTIPWESADLILNYITVRLAKESSIPLVFGFSHLLDSFGQTRLSVLSGMRHAALLIRKFKTPIILASLAEDKWEMRSPMDLVSFGKTLGFDENICKQSLSANRA